MLNSTHNPIVHRKVTHSAANALIVSGTATIVAFVCVCFTMCKVLWVGVAIIMYIHA